MAKQLQDLEAEIRTYLDEATAADWTNINVDMAANRAYHDVCSFVIEIYEGFYETTTPFTYAIVANQQEYTVDASLIKIDRVEINLNPTSTGSMPSRCQRISMDEIATNLANTNGVNGSFFSAAYYIHGNIGAQKIGFIPVPAVADTTGKSIAVWGIALPTDLVNPTDDVNIPYADRFAYLVSLRGAAQLLRKGQQEEAAAARYMQEYRAGITDMQTFLKERLSDGVWGIEDSLGEDIDFSAGPI